MAHKYKAGVGPTHKHKAGVSIGIGGITGLQGTSGVGPQVMEYMTFHEKIKELAIFRKINQKRYFKLKSMYDSTDIENRAVASAIVKELLNQMMSE